MSDPLEPHLDLAAVERFGARELSQEGTFEVGWHLFRCTACRALLDQAAPEARRLFQRMFRGRRHEPPPSGAYSEVAARYAETLRRLGLEIDTLRGRARDLVAHLLRHPPERWRLLVASHARYRSYPFAMELLAECRRGWSDDPSRSEALAELALVVADGLDPEIHPADLVNDLRAEAWAYIANCRRIRSDLRSVAEAFDLAETFLRQGSGDPLDHATVLDLQASFLIDQRRFTEAEALLDRLVRLYQDADQSHREGRALIKLAKLRREQGRADEAIPLLERAARRIDVGQEPHLELLVRRNLAAVLAETGRAEEARALLPELRRLARDRASRHEWLRLLWTEGIVYHRLGHLELAAAALAQARDGFVDLGIGYDAAFASLDLALVRLDAGDRGAVRKLAEEMVPLFASRDLHREALAALALVRQAAEAETLTRQLVETVAAFLRRGRRHPALGFDPGAALGPGPGSGSGPLPGA
jgi:tetratricopeptide (TPR) repeat protein